MSPFERASEVYGRESCARTLCQDLELHLLNGYVLATPRIFVMCRPVNSKSLYSLITNPRSTFNSLEADCWWIYLAAGKLPEFFKHLPYRLPYIGWEVNNIPRFYKIEILEKALHHDNTGNLLLQGRGRKSSPTTNPSRTNTGR